MHSTRLRTGKAQRWQQPRSQVEHTVVASSAGCLPHPAWLRVVGALRLLNPTQDLSFVNRTYR